jgi:hypothetical protein
MVLSVRGFNILHTQNHNEGHFVKKIILYVVNHVRKFSGNTRNTARENEK